AVAVLPGVAADVLDVDIAVGVALGDDHGHAAHLGAGRVGAVRRFRDQADVALGLAVGAVPGADGQQAGVFALGAGIGLQADGVIAGAGHQHLLQAVDQLAVALAL